MDTIDDELDYIEYRKDRRIYGKSIPGAVAYFGAAKVAAMEIRYGAELAIGLISESHSDTTEPCSTCGRKHYPVCPGMTRSEWHRTLA